MFSYNAGGIVAMRQSSLDQMRMGSGPSAGRIDDIKRSLRQGPMDISKSKFFPGRKATLKTSFSEERLKGMATTASGSVGIITKKERLVIIAGKAVTAGVVSGALAYFLFKDAKGYVRTPIGAYSVPVAVGGAVALAEGAVDLTMLALPEDKALYWSDMLYGFFNPAATVGASLAVGYLALGVSDGMGLGMLAIAGASGALSAGYLESKYLNPWGLAH